MWGIIEGGRGAGEVFVYGFTLSLVFFNLVPIVFVPIVSIYLNISANI